MGKTTSSDAMTHFDFLRGLAACAVVVGHVRGIFFLDYERVPHGALLKVLYLLTGLGHQSVVVFFALSGFFVGSSVLSSRDRWSWSQYLLRRFTRLYLVLVPALVATAVLDRTGMALFGGEGVYAGKLDAPYLALSDVHATGGFGTFVGNLFYLQDVFVRPFGSNGPLWSLSYELWAYILFPLSVQACAPNVTTARRIAYVGLVIAILYFGGERLRFYFPLWLSGALVAGTYKRCRVPAGVIATGARVVGVGIFLGALFLARVRALGHLDRDDMLLAAGTSCMLMALLVTTRPDGTSAPARAYAAVAKRLASFSYTLYLVHFPALMFVHAAVVSGGRWVPDATHLALGAAISAGVIAFFAYPLARLTEAHTDQVRKWVGRALRIEVRSGTAAA